MYVYSIYYIVTIGLKVVTTTQLAQIMKRAEIRLLIQSACHGDKLSFSSLVLSQQSAHSYLMWSILFELDSILTTGKVIIGLLTVVTPYSEVNQS